MSAAPALGEQEVEVLCHFSYRSSIFSGDFESADFTITIPFIDGPTPEMPLGIEDSVEFADLLCVAIGHYNSLHLQIYDAESGNSITSVLYQFGEPPENRFDGGHGFTGLHYVYHPESEAELQFRASVEDTDEADGI